MAELILRDFEATDWPELRRFYETFYGPTYIFCQKAFFEWNCYSPLSRDGRPGQRLLVDGRKIVGIMCALPWPLQVGGLEELGEYNINLFVDPEYRGHRAGQRLLEDLVVGYRHSLSAGYNLRTLSMYQRLGRVFHWPMRRFFRVVDVPATTALLNQGPRFQGLGQAEQKAIRADLAKSASMTIETAPAIQVDRPGRFDGEWDRAWDEIRTDYGFTTWRSSRFLNWRYVGYPYPLYTCLVAREQGRPVGLLVLRIERPEIGVIVRIVDLVGLETVRATLFDLAAAAAREEGALFVDYIAAGRLDESLLARAGFFEPTDDQGHSLLPMDFNPLRFRDGINSLALFLDGGDPGLAQFEAGDFYAVKGDGDQDRAN